MDRAKIKQFLNAQIKEISDNANEYLYGGDGKLIPPRRVLKNLKEHQANYLLGNRELRSFIMTGLRGAGKTTLLYQLFCEDTSNLCKAQKIFLPVDRIREFLKESLHDVLTVLEEEILERRFETLTEPLILFLDEVQYDPDWAALLKVIYDRSKKVCVFATGSSALLLQSTPDLTRRAVYEEIFPLSFLEYSELKFPERQSELSRSEEKELSQSLQTIIYQSNNAQAVYDGLKDLNKTIQKAWIGLSDLEINRYMKYGSLPFMLSINNEMRIYEMIKKNIDRIIEVDIRSYDRFSQDILSNVQAILYTLADSEEFSVTNISKSIGMHKTTLMVLMESLVKTDLITRVYPYGSNISQVRKASKYMFSSPAFRSMYFNLVGCTSSNYMGKLLEDTVAMYLRRFFTTKLGTSLSYDSSKNSADFIVQWLKDQAIIIEVGWGEKDFRQIYNSLKKVEKAKYGLNISRSELKLSKDKRAVNVPIETFLLM